MNHDGLKMWIRRTLRQPARRLWQWTLPPGDRAMVLRDMGRGRPSPGLVTELDQDFATWDQLSDEALLNVEQQASAQVHV